MNLKLAISSLLFLLTLAPLTACSSAEEKKQLEQDQLASDLKDEKEVGRAMAAKLAGTMGYYEGDPALVKYVSLVGLSLALHASRPELTFHFGILKTDDINAFATPGGFVFVTYGLLKQIRSESELAGVLGHEIAHVTERHMYKIIMPKREMTAGETVSRMLSRGGSDLGQSLSQIVNQGMEILLDKGLGQEKEQEADDLGVLLASSSGYDPGGLGRFLKRLEKGSQGSPVKESVSKTHPPLPDRIKNIAEFEKSNGLNPGKMTADPATLDARFKSFSVALGGSHA